MRYNPIATLPLLWNEDLDQMQCCAECPEEHSMSLLGGPQETSLLWSDPRLVGGLQRNWGTAAEAESGECGVHTRKSLGNNPLGCSWWAGVHRGSGCCCRCEAEARWLPKRPVSPTPPWHAAGAEHQWKSPHTGTSDRLCSRSKKIKTQHAGTRKKSPFLPAVFVQRPYRQSLTLCSL